MPDDGLEVTLGFLRESVVEIKQETRAIREEGDERGREFTGALNKLNTAATTLHGDIQNVDTKLDGHIDIDESRFASLWRLLAAVGVLGGGAAGLTKLIGG